MKKTRQIIIKLWDKFYYDILPIICAIYFPIGLFLLFGIMHEPDKTLLFLLVLLSVVSAMPLALLVYCGFYFTED